MRRLRAFGGCCPWPRRARLPRLSLTKQRASRKRTGDHDGSSYGKAHSGTGTYAFDVEDVEYLRHGDKPLLARLFKPKGAGPFPLMIDLHGGAWCNGDRLNDTPINEALARSGIVVAALDFRMPPQAAYPASMADINYGVRWLKSQASALKGRPGRVGVIGISSGGHQGMLAAMRPNDPRYARAAALGRRQHRRAHRLRGHVLAGDRPAGPLPLCATPDGGGRKISRGTRSRAAAAHQVLGRRGGHGRGQPCRRARARRESRAAARALRAGRCRSRASGRRPRALHRAVPQARRRGGPGALRRRGRRLRHAQCGSSPRRRRPWSASSPSCTSTWADC